MGTFSVDVGANTIEACKPCPPGAFAPSAGSVECALCSPGFYSDAWGQRACKACPRGRFSTRGNGSSLDACTPCAAGSYSEAPGQTTCIFCAPGTASSEVGAASAVACVACAGGTVATLAGQRVCAACVTGFFSSPDGAACVACPPGTRGSPGGGGASNASCIPCEQGSFNPSLGTTACVSCAPGFYSDVLGASSCAACPSGKYSNTPGAADVTGCLDCPAGTFNPVQGQTFAACLSCPSGRASPAPGANASAACAPCPAGSFAARGAAVCEVTPPGAFSGVTASAATLCPLNTFNPVAAGDSTAACLECPPERPVTAATGAVSAAQCLALPFSCPSGYQQRAPAPPLSARDCAPLVCPPLFPESADGNTCEGCPAGKWGGLSGGAGCANCSVDGICTGLGGRQAWNFSGSEAWWAKSAGAAAAPRLLQSAAAPAGGGSGSGQDAIALSLWDACPPLLLMPPKAPPVKSTLQQTLSLNFASRVAKAFVSGAGIFLATLLMGALYALAPPVRRTVNALAIKVDAYGLNHSVNEKQAPVKVKTPLGGMCTVLGITSITAFAAYLVVEWLDNNVLVQRSLDALTGDVWDVTDGMPWASARVGGRPAPLDGTLLLRLSVDGDAGACGVPLALYYNGLVAGAWSVLGNTSDCGGSGVSQLDLACVDCRLGPAASLSLLFHYSCQSFIAEAVAFPGVHVATTATGTSRALLGVAAGAPGAPLTAVAFTVAR
jgi:hypothetical protein